MSHIVEEAIRRAKNHTGTWARIVAEKCPTDQVPQTDTRPYRRPSAEDVARELFRATCGLPSAAGLALAGFMWPPPSGAQWERLKETAILPTGRQSFYVQTVNAIYAAMDRAEALRKAPQ